MKLINNIISNKNSNKYLIIIFLLGLIAINIFLKPYYTPDDTYIYLQYAKNISNGSGFSFNPSEPSYGVTSPFWVLLLSAGFLTCINGLWFAKILDLLSAIAAVIIFYKLTKFFFEENLLIRTISTAVFILNVWFIRWAFTGMETSFAVMLVIWVFYLFYKNKFALMFFLCGILYLVRPETFVLTVILFLIIIYNQYAEKKVGFIAILKYIVLVLITVLPFLIYAKINFGTILPNTASGKSTLTFSSSVFFSQVKEIAKTLAGSSIIEICLSALFIFKAAKYKQFYNTFPLVIWIFSLCLLYIFTDADIISRYLLIISPFFIIIGFKAIELINKKQNFIAVLILIFSIFFSQIIFHNFVKPSTYDFTEGMNNCLIPIGEWLNKNTPAESRILVNDVGAIGYYSNRYIIDAAALINRDTDLNKKIMNAPLEERMRTHKLLKFINADYVIDRDSSSEFSVITYENFKLEPEFMKKFPSLGISDRTPRYFKVYKIYNIK